MALTLSAYKSVNKVAGGIRNLYILDKEEREESSVVYTISAGVLAISGAADGVSAYKIEPRHENCTFTQPSSNDNVQGSTSYIQTLEFSVHDYSGALAVLHEQIAKGRIEVLIEYVSGKFVYAGIESNGMQMSGGDGGFSGTTYEDGLGQTYTLECKSTTAAPILAVISEFTSAFTIVEA